MMIRRFLVPAALLCVAIACSGDGATDPATKSLNTSGKPAGDTSSSGYLGTTSLTGRVLTLSRKAPSVPGGSDTLQTLPVGGVTLTLYHNELQNGVGVSVYVAETTSKSDGTYSFGPFAGGYYVVRNADVSGKWTSGVSLLYANAPAMTLDVYVGAVR